MLNLLAFSFLVHSLVLLYVLLLIFNVKQISQRILSFPNVCNTHSDRDTYKKLTCERITYKCCFPFAKKNPTHFCTDVNYIYLQVYLPCILQTKKRYVGFMYETPEQKEPVYDAKGIETVRRDTCSAVAKVTSRTQI